MLKRVLWLGFFMAALSVCRADKLEDLFPDSAQREIDTAALQASAMNGEPEAQFKLGECYLYGRGMEQDQNIAVEWIRKAAEQDYGPAVVSMVLCYEMGGGVEQDLDIAEQWYNKALDLGYSRDMEEQEPLSDYAALFAENDARLRAIDPTDTTCTNYVAWMKTAIKSLEELDRENEIDAWLEEQSAIGTNNWKLLHAVAMGYQSAKDCRGYDPFEEDEGNVEGRNSWLALRQMDRAYRLMMQTPPTDAEQSLLIRDYFMLLMESRCNDPQWLQVKTINHTLEEVSKPSFWDNIPEKIIFFNRPESYEAAASDGEILWWLAGLQDIRIEDVSIPKKLQPALLAAMLSELMLDYGRELSEKEKDLLASLADDEIATKSNDVLRIVHLPESYAFIPALLSRRDDHPQLAPLVLASIFINRFQLERAAQCYELAGQTNEVRFIRANQGTIEECPTFATGEDIHLDYRYRNGNEAEVSIYKIGVGSNLVDRLEKGEVMESELYLLSGYPKLFQDCGRQEQANALKHVDSFMVALEPSPDHRDATRRIDLPRLEGGNYLVRIQMKDGNKADTIVNVYNTSLCSYELASPSATNEHAVLLLCDALTGRPLPHHAMELFVLDGGATWNKRGRKVDGAYSVVQRICAMTDEQGCYVLDTSLYKKYQGSNKYRDDYYHFALVDDGGKQPMVSHVGWGGNIHYTYPEYHFVTTDRPIYRPGETVHLKLWKGSNTDDENLEITGPRYLNLARQNLQPDRFGGADMDVAIPRDAPLGRYSIESAGDEDNTFASFYVEEYRTPEFEVFLQQVGSGKYEVRAHYAYGDPVAKANASIKIRAYDSISETWYPERHYDDFWQSGYWWVGGQFPGKHEDEYERLDRDYFSKQIETRLDTNGMAVIDLAGFEGGMEAYENHGGISLAVKVTDAANKEIIEQQDFSNKEMEQRLCVWLDKAYYEPNEEIVCRWASKKPLTEVDIELRRVDGTNAVPLHQLAANAPDIELGKLEPGLYELQAQIENQRPSQPFRFMVLGGDTQLTPKSPIRIVREKRLYDISEPATILIQVDRPGRWVYFFDRVAEYSSFSYPRVIYMDETSKRISFPLERAGLVQCAAATVVNGKPHIVDCRLPVADRSINAGSVFITPDKDAYRPGETVHLDLQAVDKDRQGKPCAIAVTVYNQMLDTLLPEHRYHRPNIYSPLFASWRFEWDRELHFDDARCNAVDATVPDWVMKPLGWQGFAMNEVHATFSAVNPRFGANVDMDDLFGGGTLGTRIRPMMLRKPRAIISVDVPIRRNFHDTAYWNALVETDAEGRASVEFPMPDSLTEWKVEAWAMDTNYAGVGEASIVCKKDFVVQLNTPRFMIEGDDLEISGSIRTHTDTPMAVDAACTASGTAVRVESPGMARIENLGPNEEQLSYWSVAAATEGTSTVTVAAQSEDAADGMERPIPVLSHSMLKRGARSGVLMGGRSEERIVIDIPEAVDPDSLRLQVNATPNMVESVAAALPYLADYSYGCTEQTLNRFLPSLVVLQTLDKLGLDLDTVTTSMPEDRQAIFARAEIIKRAQAGIDKLEGSRNWKGFWGWNPAASASEDFMISAWVLRGLSRAAQVEGLAVDTQAAQTGLQEAVRKLSLLMQPPWRQRERLEINDAYAMLAVAIHETDPSVPADEKAMQRYKEQVGDTRASSAPFLMKHADELSLYGKILLAYTFELRGEPGPRDELIRFIDQYLETDPALGTCWLRMPNHEWWRWYNDDIEALAWYLKLLNRTEPDSAKTAGIARYLLLNRQHGDHWKSTRDTAICVEALCEFIANNPAEPNAEDARILLNGSPLADDNKLHPGHNELVIASDSKAPLFYDATWHYLSRENPITAETSELVSVSRAYYRIDPATGKYSETPMAAGETLKAGETIMVELTLHAAQELEYVLAQDFKPAGFECTETASGYRHDNLPHYRELHDERIDCYITHLPKGASTLAYHLRAEHAGNVCAMPATVELMYAPEQAANTKENRLKIER